MVTEHFDAQADEDEPGSRFQMKGRKAVQPSGQEKAGRRAQEGGEADGGGGEAHDPQGAVAGVLDGDVIRLDADGTPVLFRYPTVTYRLGDGSVTADMGRRHAEVFLDMLKGEGFAEPNPQPMFPNPPGLLRQQSA